MRRCLAILVATIVGVGLVSAILPRINGGGVVGGLTRTDLALICGLPMGAFCAGRHWYRYELFLLYGALGRMLVGRWANRHVARR